MYRSCVVCVLVADFDIEEIRFAKTINRKSLNDGKITYPKLDGECIDNTIYNNTELTIDDDSQDIIDSFVRFIENN